MVGTPITLLDMYTMPAYGRLCCEYASAVRRLETFLVRLNRRVREIQNEATSNGHCRESAGRSERGPR
jgi:hypothetical protein